MKRYIVLPFATDLCLSRHKAFPFTVDLSAMLTLGAFQWVRVFKTTALGERVWLRHRDKVAGHHKRVANALAIGSGLGLFPFAYGLLTYNLGFMCLGIFAVSVGKMWFVDRMVWVWRDFERERGSLEDLTTPL